MDKPVSRPALRSSFVLRGVAVAALLLTLISTTVYAQGNRSASQQATPVSGESGLLSTTAAVPADATAYVAINVDPDSAQFQDSAALSGTAGFIDLFNVVSGIDEADSDDISGLLEGVGATEIGVGIPAVSAEQIEALSETTTDEAPELVDQDIRIVLATSDPEDSFDFLTEQFPDLIGSPSELTEQTEYDGAPVVSFPYDDSIESSNYLALAGDLIIIAPTLGGIESSIDTVQGTTDSIASTGKFQDVTAQLDGESMLFAYTDSSAVLGDPAYTDVLAEMGIDPTLLAGFNAYTGIQVAADAAAPGFRFNTVSFPNDESGATAGATPSYSSDLTDRVPDDTMIYLGGNELGQLLGPIVSIALASAALTDIVDGAVSGPVEPATATVAGATPDADVEEVTTPEATPDSAQELAELTDLVTGFLTLLTGEYVVAIQAPQITALSDPNSLYVLFASGVDGGALVDSLLDLAADTIATPDSGTTITSEVIDGATIYTATTGSDPDAITISYGVVDGQVLVGLGDSVQSYLDGPNSSLADNPQFQETFAALGRSPEEGAVVYLDLSTLLPLALTGADLLGGTASTPDNDPACAEYDTQSDAQAAYDDEPFDNSSLDNDFDGEACEDFFAPAGTPEPVLSDVDFSNVVAYGQVTYQGDGFTASDGLFLLAPAD